MSIDQRLAKLKGHVLIFFHVQAIERRLSSYRCDATDQGAELPAKKRSEKSDSGS
jgi:hypothetical protein